MSGRAPPYTSRDRGKKGKGRAKGRRGGRGRQCVKVGDVRYDTGEKEKKVR